MGISGQLKFALLCMDFLAWPVIALGFPMFVSIRAIETGSLHHMKKLVTYWTLFSMIYLFEFAFMEILQWIPFWSSIQLMVMFWLVFPRFRGSCYVYKNFVRPCLVLNLQEAIRRFEEKSRVKSKESSFMDVADEFIKDHGFGTLEKLIATKKKPEEPYYSQRDIGLNEHCAFTLAQLEEPVAALKDENMLETVETRSEAQLRVQVQPTTEVSTTTTYSAAVTPQHKWKCTLCKVETSCESNLNDHIRGSRHKAMCESLKLSKLNTKQGSDGSKQNKSCEQPGYKKEGSALKDDNMLETLETRSEVQVQPATEVSTTTYAAAVTKGISGILPASVIPEDPVSAAVAPQRKWKCSLCKVETSRESNFNDHIRGRRHNNMCKSLRLSKLNTKQGTNGSKQNRTRKPPGYKNEGSTRHWCFACDVELVGGASLKSHLNGKRHASNVAANGLS